MLMPSVIMLSVFYAESHKIVH